MDTKCGPTFAQKTALRTQHLIERGWANDYANPFRIVANYNYFNSVMPIFRTKSVPTILAT